ncbi:hypothetical protein N7E70_002380 [Aminobacter sp. NyZ550]|uniref:hypothetical protein n=1 Tax=Aminobacter sp. NyZ550 TaxID=2979870 RepID=UPI0021D5F925|nr:hypothetical protein [Aminobacter sp. NyZ550]WAX95750.1 hypothetical protein N7E70_002380 [Aminobacter sp. NyZ550]
MRLRSASRPIVCRDCFVIFMNADTTTVLLRTGLTAAAVTHDYAAGDAVLEPSGFRPQA